MPVKRRTLLSPAMTDETTFDARPDPRSPDGEETGKLHPWARYWAKMLDVGLFSLLAGIPVAIVGLQGVPGDVLGWVLFVLFFPLAEGASIAATTGTPGKALFNIRVTDAAGEKLDLRTAVRRSYLGAAIGLGLAIPFVSFAAMIFGYIDYKKSGATYWDRSVSSVYRAAPTGKSWIVLCIIGLVTFIFLFLIAAASLAA